MGTRGTGRRRSMKTERTTAEEEALNLVSAQAEAKLAAKRAARAEAREIRLQELERQREVQDEDYSDEGSRAPSVSSPPPGGTSCQLGAGGTCKGNGSCSQNNEGMLAEVQEKYRKAMVSNAQLDNEKNKLMYVVDVLKDSLLELEELLSESRREYEDKVKEHEQEKHAHHLLMLQFREMKDTLKQHQEMLNDISDLHQTLEWKDKRIQALEGQKEFAEENRLQCNELREVQKLKDASMKHGMLKPSGSVNGAAAAPAVVGSVDADGGILGSPAETELKSPRQEDVDPQHLKEEPENGGEHLWSSETLQKHVDTSALPEEPSCSAECSLSVDLAVVTCSAAEGIGSEPPETIRTADGDAPQTQVQSAVNTGDTEKKETSRITLEEQEPKPSHVQCDSKPHPDLNVEEALQSLPIEPNCQPQHNAAELESGEKMEEKANKSQSSTTSGKKKKKKRGKRKGGSHDNKNQQETRAGNEAGANKKLKEEADIKDVNDTLKAEDEEEPGTIDASLMTKSRFPEKTLQETNLCSASGENEKTTEEGVAAEDDKSEDEEKTEGTLHPKTAQPEKTATLAEGSFQIGVLEEPTTDSMFVDLEDNRTPETATVKKEEPGVRTEEDTSGCPDKEDTSGCPAEEDTSGCPDKEDTSGCPAEEDTSGCPAEEDTSGCPAEEDTSNCPAKEDTSNCPAKEDTSSSDISELILQKNSESEGLDLIHISAAEESESTSTQSPVLFSQDDAAEASSSSESCPTKSCSGVTDSEKPFEGVVELNPGGCEAEHGGDNTSFSHDEDSELISQSQDQKLTEEVQKAGDWSDLDPPTQTEDVCASSASDLEWSPNGTCQDMGEEPKLAGAEAFQPADALEVEEKSATSEPKLEKDQHNLESESSPSHLDGSRSCGGGPEEEDGEDGEEQSFDFDDTELELAAVRSPSKDPEPGETVMVTSADTNAFKSGQSHSEEEPRQNNSSKSEPFRDTESDAVGQENSSGSCEAPPEKLENTSTKPTIQTDESIEVEETHAVNPKELRGSADSDGQTELSAAKTDMDPVRQKDKDFPNLREQAGGSTEAPLEGKDAKKSSRKGKGKSKEECKMS
ncbi:leucine-rich repeat flightless-interacting protein 1 isoform X2 [Oryzias melastigma]|uniref:leucine-rich repeat flightless-interacting protein 1 isoform X2 n=1 Tax=Oryzias melastigma TaxID=30732 RepID=UPI00168D3F19|nr:leucine-rich repeat flightless-interacting protein 1 isoform X2 [Oryzias melastigma]